MKAFLTVGNFARWEKFVGDAAVYSSASKKSPTFFEKTPMFLEKSPTFLEKLPTFFRKRPTFYALCLPWLVNFRYLCTLERCVLAREKSQLASISCNVLCE